MNRYSFGFKPFFSVFALPLVFLLGSSVSASQTLTWSIPSYNLSGSIVVGGGITSDGPSQKRYGFFKISDENGKLLAMISPKSLDSLRLRIQARMNSRKGSISKLSNNQSMENKMFQAVEKLKSIMEDEARMRRILAQIDSQKGNGPSSLWNWTHIISTVRSMQETVNGSVDW